jgi:hypothetical protein
MEKTGQFRYKIKSMGASSDKYGNCEVCGKRVSDIHLQTSEELVVFEPIGDESDGTHWVHRGSVWGHEECLIGIQVKGVKEL